MTETAPFTTTSGTYLATLISLWLPRHGWKVAVPLIAVAAACMIIPDERLILVALMLLFIVIPMGMSFLYTYYMLTPEARRAILPKRITIDPGKSLHLHYISAEDTEDKDENGEDANKFPIPEDEIISWSGIKRVRYTSRGCVYILDTPRLQFILVPYEAIPRGSVLAP